MADIYDEEYVNRKLAEVVHCKTCGQLMTPELQNWRWYRLKMATGFGDNIPHVAKPV